MEVACFECIRLCSGDTSHGLLVAGYWLVGVVGSVSWLLVSHFLLLGGVRMAEGEEWKIVFRTRYGLFKFLVMPFGLTNAPDSFQHFINDVLQPYLDIFITVYLDNILIYSNNLNDYWNHILKVLEALSEAGLHLILEKCEFHQQEVKYLGFIISTIGIKMDPAKVTTIQAWPIPRNMQDIQSFLGFANFYRCFVQGYSNIVTAITQLTRKNTHFVWSEECS
jgi:hypothetical protein